MEHLDHLCRLASELVLVTQVENELESPLSFDALQLGAAGAIGYLFLAANRVGMKSELEEVVSKIIAASN